MKAYQVKITMSHSNPEIYRRILIPGGCSFKQFHQAIQAVFGWDDSHPYEFVIDSLGIKFRKSTDYDYRCEYVIKRRRSIIGDYLQAGMTLHYIYHPLNYWDHVIVVEKELESKNNEIVLLDYQGENLVECCGGIQKYYQIKEILKDPSHKNYEYYHGWFVLNNMDVNLVTRQLDKIM